MTPLRPFLSYFRGGEGTERGAFQQGYIFVPTQHVETVQQRWNQGLHQATDMYCTVAHPLPHNDGPQVDR